MPTLHEIRRASAEKNNIPPNTVKPGKNPNLLASLFAARIGALNRLDPGNAQLLERLVPNFGVDTEERGLLTEARKNTEFNRNRLGKLGGKSRRRRNKKGKKKTNKRRRRN
jgi:hypothetical protein